MRYFPDLIPEEHRVLKDYFKGGLHQKESRNEFIKSCSIVFGIILIICSILTVSFFPFTVVLIATGMLLFPKLNTAVAAQLKLKLTGKVRVILGIILLSINVLFGAKFVQVRSELIQKEHHELQLAQKVFQENQRKESIRRDSLDLYLNNTDTLAAANQTDLALLELDRAKKFARTDSDNEVLSQKRAALFSDKANNLSRIRKYAEAIKVLDQLYELDSTNSEVNYQKALCYSKLNNMKASVYYCRRAMEKGNSDAEQLHEKINPLRRRVAEYVTLCNDGTTSGARGRGACSHHGGVATWYHPIYEEYRKY